MEKILITGGAGFFGSKMTEKLLSKGKKVIVYDNLQFGDSGILPFINNENYEFVLGCVKNTSKLNEIAKRCDVIIHLAAYVGEKICKENNLSLEDVNINSSLNLVKLSEEENKQFIFMSTCSNYGKTNNVVDEDSDLKPSGLYSESKIKTEKLMLENHTSFLILRCATLFGVSYRMRFDLTINQLIYEILKDNVATVYGEDAWRPYIHISDAVEMVSLCIDKKLKGIYNLGDNSLNYTKKQIISELKKNIDFSIKSIVWDDIRDYKVNFNKIKSILNYNIKYDLNRGIEELLNHMSYM